MNKEIILEVDRVSFEYPNMQKALQNICFSIEKGTKVFFHGRNGAGKTTLFQCLSGLLPIQKGDVKVNGLVLPKERERMKKISLLFQNANDQLIAGTVFEEVAFGLFNLGLSDREVIEKTRQVLHLLNLEDLEDRPPHFLSYGQKKKVTIASILTLDAEIILLDEPTAGLDPMQSEELVRLLDQLTDAGKTLLISTHDTDFSFRCADQVVMMDQGNIIGFGEPVEIFSNQLLLEKGGLTQPLILAIVEQIKQGHLAKADYPKNREELFRFLAENLRDQDLGE